MIVEDLRARRWNAFELQANERWEAAWRRHYGTASSSEPCASDQTNAPKDSGDPVAIELLSADACVALTGDHGVDEMRIGAYRAHTDRIAAVGKHVNGQARSIAAVAGFFGGWLVSVAISFLHHAMR